MGTRVSQVEFGVWVQALGGHWKWVSEGVTPSCCRDPGVSSPEECRDCVCKIIQCSAILARNWLAMLSIMHVLLIYVRSETIL